MIDSICVYGYHGNIGKHHYRKLSEREDTVDPGTIYTGDYIKLYGVDVGGIVAYNAFQTDAVILATPSNTHYELAKIAIEGGTHLLVEKPITLNYKEAQTLYRLAQTYNVVFYTGHCYRYLPQFRENLPELFHTPMLDFKLLVKHDKPLSEAVFDLAIHGIEIAFFLGDQQKGRNFNLKSAHIGDKSNQIHIEANIGSKHCKFVVGYGQQEDVRTLKGYNINGDTEAFVDFHSSDGKEPDAMSNLHAAFIKSCNVGVFNPEAEHAVAAIQLAEQIQNKLFPKGI